MPVSLECEPDGLYLYRGNYRMRTNGSETEKLVNRLSVPYTDDNDETAYKTLRVSSVRIYQYSTENHTAIFCANVIPAGNDMYLIFYNYQTKTDKILTAVSDECDIFVSDSYYYVRQIHETDGAESVYERLYTVATGDLVCESTGEAPQDVGKFVNGSTFTRTIDAKTHITYKYDAENRGMKEDPAGNGSNSNKIVVGGYTFYTEEVACLRANEDETFSECRVAFMYRERGFRKECLQYYIASENPLGFYDDICDF